MTPTTPVRAQVNLLGQQSESGNATWSTRLVFNRCVDLDDLSGLATSGPACASVGENHSDAEWTSLEQDQAEVQRRRGSHWRRGRTHVRTLVERDRQEDRRKQPKPLRECRLASRYRRDSRAGESDGGGPSPPLHLAERPGVRHPPRKQAVTRRLHRGGTSYRQQDGSLLFGAV
ncbi:MAG: hypothetical protein JWO99_63 [Candidatus Saccharibacteria bacterium]|nr:hypothetical protein [Candidatus Saccharibacteria bacterium]